MFEGLKPENVTAVEWESTNLQELDITATDLSTDCLVDIVSRCTNLRYFAAGQQDGFNDLVLNTMIEKGTYKNLITLDLDRNENISEEMLLKIVRLIGPQLQGLVLSGIPHLCEGFWSTTISVIKKIKYVINGSQMCFFQDFISSLQIIRLEIGLFELEQYLIIKSLYRNNRKRKYTTQ